MLKKLSLFMLLVLLATVGCSAITNTGQTSSDAAAAQKFFPTVSGYNATAVDNIVDALSTVAKGANLATGNVLGAAALAKLDSMKTCYQNAGAVDAKVYTRIAVPPIIGVLVIVNRDRLIENFMSCAVGASGLSAGQSTTEPQPCVAAGSFKAEDDTFDYVYVATDRALCTEFANHLNQYPKP